MVQYVFFFDDDGEFVCQRHIGDAFSEIVGSKAISKLKDVDKLNYNHVNATKKQVKLKSDNIETILFDISDFYKHNYTKYLPKSISKIKRAIEKYQKSKHKGKKVSPLKAACNGIVVASVVSMLIASSSSIKNVIKNTEVDKTDDLKKFESSIDTEPIIVKTENTMTDQIDDLINELEQEENNKLEQAKTNNLEDNKTNDNEQMDVAYLSFEDLTDSITYNGAHDKFYDIVEHYANKWGFSPNVEMAILTQESAGKLENLTEVIFKSWQGQKIKVYDFLNHRYQRIVLDNDVAKYADSNIMVITEEDLKNPETNISVSCIILRYCFEQMKYNIPAAIQMYNMGYGNMHHILDETSRNTGLSVDELLEDKDNVDFLNYTYIIDDGDHKYLNNISRYLTDDGEISFKVLNDDGTIDEVFFKIQQKTL